MFPEADLATAEAAARLVPGAHVVSENTGPGGEAQPDNGEKPAPESVPNDDDPLGEIREINSHPLTQAAPDEEPEAV